MNIRFTAKALMFSLLLTLMSVASAQTTGTSSTTGTAGATATTNVGTSSGALSNAETNGNAQNIAFNSPAQLSHTTETVRTAPSEAIGSFGTSFSTDNCSNTIAGSLSVIGVGASAGRALQERNCAHIRLGYAFGQAAAYSRAVKQYERADSEQALSDYSFCTGLADDSNIQQACADMHLVKIVQKRDQNQNTSAVIVPNPSYTNNDGSSRTPFSPQSTGEVILTHSAGWTGVAGVPPQNH